jgi:transposase-like protein
MVEQSLEVRAMKGKEIAEMDDQVRRLDDTTYKVRSQSGKAIYEVVSTESGWSCQCPDFRFRAIKCKHIWAVEFSFSLHREVEKRVEPIASAEVCLYCGSAHIKKMGLRHNLNGDIQRFLCLDCNHAFSFNIGFERMKHNPQAITTAMQLYFSGESLRNTQKSLRLIGVQVSHQTVLNWIGKYVSLMETYTEKLRPNLGDAWRADEIFVKFSGDMKYVFALMDDQTRFWIAQQVATNKGTDDVKPMFREGAEYAGKNPKVLITDGAPNYIDGARAFSTHFKHVTHIREIRLTGTVHNNKMERMNGEIRDREKVMRGLKVEETPILTGMQIYHNFIRPHMALKGKTPAEAAGIKVEGANKWLTLIQNAAARKGGE